MDDGDGCDVKNDVVSARSVTDETPSADTCDGRKEEGDVGNGQQILSILQETSREPIVSPPDASGQKLVSETTALLERISLDESVPGENSSLGKSTEEALQMSELFEAELDEIIARVSPCPAAVIFRSRVYRQVEQILRIQCQAVEVAPFGSFPLGTFLPDGDIDICAIFSPYAVVEQNMETTAQHYARTNGDVARFSFFGNWQKTASETSAKP